MKRIIAALTLLILSTSVFAWTIGPMNYQGRLLDNAGIPVTGTYNFKVRIYDALSGGVLKFSEDQNNVVVADGVYSFLVSTGTSPTGTWDINLWNTPTLYLEIAVSGQTLTPRHLLASTPFAFQANLALTTNNALALGGKSSGAVLQDICKAGKGKWLELANQGAGTCLGIASSFPGPTQVNITTLTASTDFTNLDLTNADISGINFGAVNFTGTLLKNTIVKGGSFTGANFTNSTWDGVTTTTAMTVNFDMTRAKMKNMSLAAFTLTDASRLSFISIAYITACPVALPAFTNWTCRVQLTTPSTVYYVTGNSGFGGINYSRDSAMADDTLGVARLKVNSFDGANVSNADFRGMYINQSFTNASYYGSDFTNSEIWGVDFSSSGGGDAAIFDNAVLHYVNFSNPAISLYMTSSSFLGTTLDSVNFRGVILEAVSFQGVTMFNSDFSRYDDNGAGVGFVGASIHNSKFWKINQMAGDFTNAKFYGAGPGSLPTFWNSDIRNMTFTGAKLTDMVFDNTVTFGIASSNTNFTNTTWINPYFGNSAGTSPVFTGVNFQGAKFLETTATLWTNIPVANWAGARCPDNFLIPNPNSGGVKCNVGHLLP